MKSSNVKRNCWPLAIVKDVKYSSDNLVRSVVIQMALKDLTHNKTYERPLSDIILLVPNDK